MVECKVPMEQLRTSGGIQMTQGLFVEWVYQTGFTVFPYTLKDYDHKGCASMYKIYMSHDTEYEAAQELVGSWKHWLKLCECTWFQKYIVAWRKERDVRDNAIGKKVLIEQALDGSITAAKTLFDIGRIQSKGRPSKQDKAKLARDDKDLDDFIKSSYGKITVVK